MVGIEWEVPIFSTWIGHVGEIMFWILGYQRAPLDRHLRYTEEATIAYDRAASNLHGPGALTNLAYPDLPPGSSLTPFLSPELQHHNLLPSTWHQPLMTPLNPPQSPCIPHHQSLAGHEAMNGDGVHQPELYYSSSSSSLLLTPPTPSPTPMALLEVIQSESHAPWMECSITGLAEEMAAVMWCNMGELNACGSPMAASGVVKGCSSRRGTCTARCSGRCL